MVSKLVFLGVCAFVLTTVSCRSLEKTDDSDEKEEKKITLESLKEFVRTVDRYNLNVSVIGSENKYSSNGWMKEDMSLNIRMPVSDEHVTQATLNDDVQDKYLKKLKKLAEKDNVAAKTRVIKVANGQDKLQDEEDVNSPYLIDSPSYKALTSFKNGVQGFSLPENETNQILYNYVVTDPRNPVKNVQVFTGKVVVTELEVSQDFPPKILLEAKNVLQKLWLSIDDPELLSRLLVQDLDKKFEASHQVIVGVKHFGLHGKKFANLKIANDNVLIYI